MSHDYKFLLPHPTGSATAPGVIGEAVQSHFDTQNSVGLRWGHDPPVAETSTWRHTTLIETNIHEHGEIRTRNPSKRAAANPCLRLRGDRNRHIQNIVIISDMHFVTKLKIGHLKRSVNVIAYCQMLRLNRLSEKWTYYKRKWKYNQ